MNVFSCLRVLLWFCNTLKKSTNQTIWNFNFQRFLHFDLYISSFYFPQIYTNQRWMLYSIIPIYFCNEWIRKIFVWFECDCFCMKNLIIFLVCKAYTSLTILQSGAWKLLLSFKSFCLTISRKYCVLYFCWSIYECLCFIFMYIHTLHKWNEFKFLLTHVHIKQIKYMQYNTVQFMKMSSNS